jgi:hypothetical protein
VQSHFEVVVSGQTASKARIMYLFRFVSFYSLFFKDVHNFETLNVRGAASNIQRPAFEAKVLNKVKLPSNLRFIHRGRPQKVGRPELCLFYFDAKVRPKSLKHETSAASNGHQGQVFPLLYVHNFFGLKRPQFSSKIFFFSRSRSSIATKYCLSAASNAGLFAESVFKIFILKFWISIKSKYAASYGSTTVYAPSRNHYLSLSRLIFRERQWSILT